MEISFAVKLVNSLTATTWKWVRIQRVLFWESYFKSKLFVDKVTNPEYVSQIGKNMASLSYCLMSPRNRIQHQRATQTPVALLWSLCPCHLPLASLPVRAQLLSLMCCAVKWRFVLLSSWIKGCKAGIPVLNWEERGKGQKSMYVLSTGIFINFLLLIGCVHKSQLKGPS